MLIAALCIKLYDHGPVFFKQKRLTIGGKEFYVYKFRSMIVDAEKDGVAPGNEERQPHYAGREGDPRDEN